MSTVNVQFQTLSDARTLGNINDLLGQSLSRLSSGARIVSPSQDPAGVGSIGKLEGQTKRTQAASINVQNASSFVQASTGFIGSMSKILSRMSELGQFANDDTKSSDDIALYQTEFTGLQDQLRQTIGGSTADIGGTADIDKPLGTFNEKVLFGANPSGLSISSSSHLGDTITIPETNLRDGAMREIFFQDASGNYTMQVTDPDVTAKITAAMNDLSNEASTLGGVDSRLELAAQSLAVENENITAALSRIQDVDVATESTRMTKLNILVQGATAMLSQANQSPKSVLKLLQA